ncbi:ACT domain-containing protein [Clostridium sp. SYSU_GA19001]|uniref:ACT domain-containing protein n=1 Tax=Clostridium caldaquaticum TaxID=2940653 RepID=UPI0020772667|nr:ACT domain-containing protein [Clostridium caldaquaticum]MCM8711362.1 ACT domain-containing protein [Clostridium caldaquaticum]
MITNSYFVIELIVNNHPGVMTHITGLFARRAFNLEGILCGRIGDGTKSKMYLLINDDESKDQIIKQLRKLYDVLEVNIHSSVDNNIFDNMDRLLELGGV